MSLSRSIFGQLLTGETASKKLAEFLPDNFSLSHFYKINKNYMDIPSCQC